MIFCESSKQFWLLIFHEIFNLNIRGPFKELWHMSENIKRSIVFLGLVNIFVSIGLISAAFKLLVF